MEAVEGGGKVDRQGYVKTIVAALGSEEDQARLQTIFRFPEWKVEAVRSLRGLSATLRATPSSVVITDSRLPDGHSWKDVLDDLVELWNRPQVIVVDRLADEAIWAEILNLGCYDLLTTPFEPVEVQRVVSRAWEFQMREAARVSHTALRATTAVGLALQR